jgi:hypothetical protein
MKVLEIFRKTRTFRSPGDGLAGEMIRGIVSVI